MPEDILTRLDGTRGEETRSAWVLRLIDRELTGQNPAPAPGSLPIPRSRRFCYVSVRLPGEREPAPILRLRYQGSADQWVIEIYLASSDQYTEAELPTSFGPKTGTPEEGVDDTSILYAGPKTGH